MCEFANVGSGLKNQINWQRSSVCAHPNQTYQHFIRYGGDLFVFFVQWFHNHSTKWRCGCTSEEEEQQIQKAGSFPNVAAVTHIWVYFKHGKFPNWNEFGKEFLLRASPVQKKTRLVADWSSSGLYNASSHHYCTQLKTQTYNISDKITHHRSRLDSS